MTVGVLVPLHEGCCSIAWHSARSAWRTRSGVTTVGALKPLHGVVLQPIAAAAAVRLTYVTVQ